MVSKAELRASDAENAHYTHRFHSFLFIARLLVSAGRSVSASAIHPLDSACFKSNINPLFPALRSAPTAVSGASRQKQSPSSHHIAYLFNWIEQPWRTQEIVHKIMNEFYKATPGGIIGNEDCGQMSAWYILSALGIYQVAPGDTRFSIGVPLFPKARIPLKGGKAFVVKTKDGGKENPYVQRVTLNGKALTTPFIDYADIMSGAELVFEMGDKKTVFWK